MTTVKMITYLHEDFVQYYDYLIEIAIAFAYCKSIIPCSCFSWRILE
jgi:hypothetical protein